MAAVFPGQHTPGAKGAGIIQRRAEIQRVLIVIPAARRTVILQLIMIEGAFTHQVDRATRSGSAEAVKQIVGAAQDLHVIEHRHIEGGGEAGVTVGFPGNIDGRAAVDAGAGDLKPARVKLLFTGVGSLLHGDPGGLLHRIVQRADTLLLHGFTGDHADRLRSVLYAGGPF